MWRYDRAVVDVSAAEQVLESCRFRDEDDDCTYRYTVENPKDKDLEVQVLKEKGERHIPPSGSLFRNLCLKLYHLKGKCVILVVINGCVRL